MSSNANLNIARNFKREEPALNTHPMRGKLKREHLLRKDAADVKRERMIMLRDILISVMGGVSALVPLYIATQTVMGA